MLKNRIRYFLHTPSFKHISTLVTGSGISQLIPLLAAPIVARLYDPADYAVLAAYTSVTIILTVVATGMYDSALMLDKNDKEALNTAAAASAITMVTGTVALIAMLLFRTNIARFTGNENVLFWLYLVPLTVIFSGFHKTLGVWNNRKQRYKRLATNKVILTAVSSILIVSLGFLGMKEKGLLISMILGQAFAFGLLFFQTLFDDRHLLSFISNKSMRNSIVKHSDFPKYNMPTGLLEGFYESGVLLIISNFFGPFALGSFSFTKRILMKPLDIIGASIGQVFYQQASNEYNVKRNIYSITRRYFFVLLIICFPFFALITIWGESIFEILFSNKWAEAGKMAQILSIQLFFLFITSPISSIPLILTKQKPFLVYNLLSKGAVLLGFFLCGHYQLTIFQSLIAFVLIRSSFSAYLIVWYYLMLKEIRVKT